MAGLCCVKVGDQMKLLENCWSELLLLDMLYKQLEHSDTHKLLMVMFHCLLTLTSSSWYYFTSHRHSPAFDGTVSVLTDTSRPVLQRQCTLHPWFYQGERLLPSYLNNLLINPMSVF